MLSEFLEQGRHQAFGPQRPLPRAGSAYRRPGRAHGRGDHRHQHGRPRHRHPAWRQPRFPDAGRIPDLVAGTPEYEAQAEKIRAEIVAEKAARARSSAACYVLGTERHESRRIDNQLRGRSGRQGDPGLSQLLPQPRRRSAAHLRPADDVLAADEQEPRGRRGDRHPVDLQGDRDRAEEGRGAQLRHPQAGRRIRRRDERPAQGHLRAARRHHGRRKRQRRHRRHARRNRGRRSSPSAARRAPIPSSGTSTGSRKASTRCSASSRRSTTGCRKKRSSRK